MDVVVVGGSIIDLISYSRRFPKPGETLIGSKFSKGFGGKGANQCIMAQRLGASTVMITKVGDDTFGDEYIKNFKENEINHDYVSVAKGFQTSSANIIVTDKGENSIVYVPGAMAMLSSNDIIQAEDVIQKAKVLLCTYECPEETLLEAVKIGKRHGVKIVVNGAPSQNYNLYGYTDIFCVNEIEAQDIINQPLDDMDTVHTAVKILLDKGCQTVIITLGANGSVVQSKNSHKAMHIPVQSVIPVDTTGAGDAFMGSLVYYLAKHPELSLEEMITRSCSIATKSVQRPGTQTSFPYRRELPSSLF